MPYLGYLKYILYILKHVYVYVNNKFYNILKSHFKCFLI